MKDYNLYKIAKTHTVQSQSRQGDLEIKSMLSDFCINVDMSTDTDISMLIFKCSVSKLSKELVNSKSFNGIPLFSLVQVCWDLSIPLNKVCELISNGNDLTMIYTLFINDLKLIDSDYIYKIPFKLVKDKGYSSGKVKNKRVETYSYCSNVQRDSMAFVLKGKRMQIGYNNIILTWEDFLSFYNEKYKLISKSGKRYSEDQLVTIYDTLRYTGCSKEQACQQFSYILENGFEIWSIPMYYFESLSIDDSLMDDCDIIGSGFLTASDIAYLCDYDFSSCGALHRRMFKEDYLCTRYISALNEGNLPEKFSVYLSSKIRYNRGVIFDKSNGVLIRDISEYINNADKLNKSKYSLMCNKLGFSTCFI